LVRSRQDLLIGSTEERPVSPVAQRNRIDAALPETVRHPGCDVLIEQETNGH
jgi:hypothetical protein